MKRAMLTIRMMICGLVIYAQTDTSKLYGLNLDYSCLEVGPKFPGGHKRMQKILSDSMRYPIEAERQGIGGKIKVVFAVDTLGNTINIKISEGIRDDLNQEALRLVGLLKGWTPGSINGRSVVYYLVQPFRFNAAKKINVTH